MDYEKAYKAVLKTATQWIKDGCTDKEKICLECVFPELRESEDERIRKWLIEYFGSIKETVWIHRDITCGQILSWLEKQKEQKPAEWSEEDEMMRQGCIDSIKYELLDNGMDDEVETDPRIVWLKSLRPSWKPSEEQMGALYEAAREAPFDRECGNALYELYDQLQKL